MFGLLIIGIMIIAIWCFMGDSKEILTGDELRLSVGTVNPKNPTGTTSVKITILDIIGKTRVEKYILQAPFRKVFTLNPGDTVTQLDVITSDKMTHQLRYPKLNSNIILDSYYAEWFRDKDSNWMNTWCDKSLTGAKFPF